MNKFLLASGLLVVTSIPGFAQQLQGDLDNWETCTVYKSFNQGTTDYGTQPKGWHSANIAQHNAYVVTDATYEVIEEVQGVNNNAARLYNVYAGMSNVGAPAPSYLTLGTPWSYAKTTGNIITGIKIAESDGGTFGGKEFSYKPDAISFDYKRILNEDGAKEHVNTDEPATVVAYGWKGSFSKEQKVGYNGGAEIMVDRDRYVLGKETDGVTKSADAELIYKFESKIEGEQKEWKNIEIPFEYVTESTPAKINVIFSSADYFTTDRNKIGVGNSLYIDNVKLIYYKDLIGLTYGDITLDKAKIEQEMQENGVIDLSSEKYESGKLKGESNGHGATIEETSYDPATSRLTLTVKGNDWSENNKHERVYYVQFKPEPSAVADRYHKLVKVDVSKLGMEGPSVVSSINYVVVEPSESNDGTVDFTMDNFAFGTMSLGTIKLIGANLSYAKNGSINITTTEEQDLDLSGIHAKVSLDGNVAVVNGKKELIATVNIKWLVAYPNEVPSLPILVNIGAIPFNTTFDGKTLKVTGSVAADEAAAVIPMDTNSPADAPVKVDVNVVDLTEAALTGEITSSAFAAKNPNTLFYAAEGATLTGDNVVKGTVCDNFVLTDGQSFNAPEGFTANQITYKRTTAASTDEKDEVYTFVLPFTFTADKVNGTVYELAGVNGGVLDFTSLEGSMELKANRPYLVVSSNGNQLLNTAAFSGEVLATDNLTNEVYGGVTMVGAYEATKVKSEGNENWYGYDAKGQFVKANTGTINPFRTAIKSTGSQSSFALKLDGTVTGIVNLENPNAKVDVYTLSGVCVRKNVPAATALNGLDRGVYIVGGQKVVK